MVEPLQLRDLAWAFTTFVKCALLAQLGRRKFLDDYPWFCSNVASTILQSLVIAVLYRAPNLHQFIVWKIAWGSQLVVVCFRFQAVVELIRTILGAYLGIWALAWRLLFGVGVLVMANSLVFSKGDWFWISVNVDRGLELSMAAIIVTLLLFARYYRLPLQGLHLALAVGLCLYSTFFVVDYTLLEKHVRQFA